MRYFIQAEAHRHCRDEEEAGFPDLASAIEEARAAARELISELVLKGLPIDLRRRVLITDDRGSQKAEVLFGDVMTLINII